jgi:hypothetical protein
LSRATGGTADPSDVDRRPIAPTASRSLAYPEAMRCIFCALVVLGHTELSLMGLAITSVAGFFAISLGFAMIGGDRTKIRGRIQRLVLLWCVWSLAYSVLLTLKALHAGKPPFDWIRAWMVITGTSLHLWFLPALALALLAWITMPERWHTRKMGAVLLGLTLAAVLSTAQGPEWMKDRGVAQLRLGTIIAMASIGFALVIPRKLEGWIAFPAAALLLASILGHAFGLTSMACHLAVIPATIALCRVPQPATPSMLANTAALTSGVYLVHMAVLTVLHGIGVAGIAKFPTALACSVVLVLLGRRSRLRPYFG